MDTEEDGYTLPQNARSMTSLPPPPGKGRIVVGQNSGPVNNLGPPPPGLNGGPNIVGPPKLGPNSSPNNIRPPQVGPNRVSPNNMGPPQVGPNRVSPNQVGPPQERRRLPNRPQMPVFPPGQRALPGTNHIYGNVLPQPQQGAGISYISTPNSAFLTNLANKRMMNNNANKRL